MRTPLTLIRGAATLLVSSYEQLPPDRALQMLRLIELGVETLTDQVEDLIASYHLEAGDLRLQVERVEVARIIEPVLDAVRRREERPIELVGVERRVQVKADRERAMQALRALVTNAVRFSPSGQPVEVTVSGGRKQVTIEVQDRGPGIPARDRELVFERFARLPRAGAGAGLGLYLARGLARAMGGDVGFRPRRDGGSVFWFTLSC